MISILIPSSNEPRIHDVIRETENIFPDAQIIVCNDSARKGKGWAIRTALQYAQGDIICFIDGDMDIHPKMIKRLLPFLEDYDIAVGKKQHRKILSRRILTILSKLWVRSLLNIGIDTQTGLKLFRRDALCSWETDGFMFDVEILAKARLAGKQIIEVPVEVTTSRKASLSSIWKCIKESLRIKERLC